MKELLVIAVSSAFVSNVVLSQFLGICSFVGVSKKVETAAGMGGAVIFVITIASIAASLLYPSSIRWQMHNSRSSSMTGYTEHWSFWLPS